MEEKIIDYLLNLLKNKGSNIKYGNENVSQLAQALQCAELAEQKKLPKATIAAALLHDIGHLLYEDADPIYQDKDGHHEQLGADFLSKYFKDEVTIPIRAHVESKRYLSCIEKDYYNLLSKASQKSLEVQGGPLTQEESKEFINKPFMREAVELRRLDDQAKKSNKETPNLDYFRNYLEEAQKNYNKERKK